jgi:tRNA-specific 2-thiouridylase
MRVAAHLEIDFLTLDLSQEYKKGVADYMISEYEQGRTPNPDVMCNKEIKFGSFFNFAISKGADFVATGHYAQIGRDNSTNNIFIKKGFDKNKDQSYFLWAIRREILDKIIFPVGNLEKNQVRKIADKAKLPNANRKDSQGICFLGMVDMQEFLSHYIETKQGDVLDSHGNIIGYHPGAIFFTIGERHGFTITDKTPDDRPFYVLSKNIENNTITVGYKSIINPETQTKNDLLTLKNTNLFYRPLLDKKYDFRLRYRQDTVCGKIISIDDDVMKVRLTGQHELYSKGQSCVIYENENCIGGGVID